jgi:D-alanyl-D-alanine carboxypeptidase
VYALVGRVFRSFAMLIAFFALTGTVQAAPFAAIVMDARSGETLWQKNADTRLHPASLTKMMTLYIAFQEIEAGRMSLDTTVTVSKHAAAQVPSRLGLKPGQKIAMRYLIRAAAIKSANDAAMAIGEHIGKGSEAAFAKRMTKTARALGMKSTTFKNPNGLTAEGHLSTARDMTVLGRHLFYDFPQYYGLFARRTADAGMAQVRNTNTRFLDAYEGADGIKTGYTVAAGFNLTASAKRGNVRIIATIFGGPSTAARNAKMAELMDLGFSLAKKRTRTATPEPAPLPPESALVAEAAPAAIDEPGVEGGSAKTIRVTGLVTRSLRPRPRPGLSEPQPEVPAALALAIAEGVDSALAEATAPPPPDGTFEAQALALAEVEHTDTPAEIAALIEEGVIDEGATATATPAPPPGTLEAQATALADGAAPAETPAPAPMPEAESRLATLRPEPRPEMPQASAAEAATEIAAAAPAVTPPPAPEPETVLAAAPPLETVAPAETAGPIVLAEAETEAFAEAAMPEVLAEVQAIETVSAPATDPAGETPARAAPIFDSVEVAAVAPEDAEALVVVSKSTSGGAQWSVNVGAFISRSEAERTLTKTGIAESATLEGGTRKITERSGKYRATFLGLTADQADLACRRIRARGQACEAQGPA